MLLFAFFTWEALGFLQSFPQFAFGVLYLEGFASFQSFASLERFASLESFEAPAKLPTICFRRSFLDSSLQAFKALQAWKGLQALKALGFLQSFPKFAFGVLYLDSSLAWL